MSENSRPSTYFLLDFDRTLLDTIKNAAIYKNAVAEVDPALGKMLDTQLRQYDARGESFAMRDFIEENFYPDGVKEVDELYLEMASKEDLLMPEAARLLKALETADNVQHGILTYGSAPAQTLKLRASGLDTIPYLVITEPHKGVLIDTWRKPDGTFIFPTQLALGRRSIEAVRLVDDKLSSFTGMGEGIKGYWYQPENARYTEGQVTTTAITPIRSLGEVIRIEGL